MASLAPGKLITPLFRLSFPALWEPKAAPGSIKLKYSITMLFPKGTDLRPLRKLAYEACAKKFGDDKHKWPTNLRVLDFASALSITGKDGWPFRDGDAATYDGYAGQISVKASSDGQPAVVDRHKNPIIIREDVYAGCYCHAVITAYAWNQAGNQGVSFGLLALQKVKEGEAFGKRYDPNSDFDSLDDGWDNPSSFEEDGF